MNENMMDTLETMDAMDATDTTETTAAAETACSPASASAFDMDRYRRQLAVLADGYVCPLCLGNGVFMAEEKNTAYICSCRPIRSALGKLRKQGLDQAARAMTFDSFRPAEPWQQQMLSAALAYVSQEKPGWLFLGGQTGCGKTHLGTAAAVALALRGQEFVYMPWTREVMRLKALSIDERRDEAMARFLDAPILYIDDLFKSPPTEADKHIAFELLSARCTRDDRPTIISSERLLSDLFEIDEALAGRIAERCGKSGVLQIPRDRRKNYRLAGLM